MAAAFILFVFIGNFVPKGNKILRRDFWAGKEHASSKVGTTANESRKGHTNATGLTAISWRFMQLGVTNVRIRPNPHRTGLSG